MSRIQHPLVGMFLSKFDMKKGNIVEWGLNSNRFKNLEFKALPSGIHDLSDDVISFKVFKDELDPHMGAYDGIAYFKQNSYDENVRNSADGQIDRSRVLMYSLGIILEEEHHESAEERVPCLERLLSKWLEKGDYTDFSSFIEYFESSEETLVSEQGRKSKIEYFPFWINRLGPLMFPIWKSLLLKERLLILNPSGGSFELCNSLAYCLSKLSDVCGPSTVKQDLLHTIGTFDIDFMESALLEEYKNNGYIACTSDEVLVYNTELYDKVLKLPAVGSIDDMMDSGFEYVIEFATNNEKSVKATPRELEIYESFFQGHYDENLSDIEKQRLKLLTEPLSWWQFFLDGLYFCFTAGTQKASYHHMAEETQVVAGEKQIIDGVLKYYSERSKTLLESLERVLELQDKEHVTVALSVLTDLDLDCFSGQDVAFVERLSEKYFSKDVNVEWTWSGLAYALLRRSQPNTSQEHPEAHP